MHTLIRFTLGLAAPAFGAILPATSDSITETRAAAGSGEITRLGAAPS